MIQKLKNNGFSLLELLLAAGIGSALLLFTTQFLKDSDSSNKKIQADLEDTADNLNMEALLRKDFTNIKHSLNNLKLKDDKGNNFFDYLSSSTCTSSCEREIKLELGDTHGSFSKKALYFIIINQAAGEQQMYNPADAYPKGSLTFNSLNYNNTLSIRPGSPWNSAVQSKPSLMFLYSPIEVFSPTAGVDSPGRMLSFMGWVNATNFNGSLKAEFINDNGLEIYSNDDLRTGLKITSEDLFLKNMPYTSGLGSFSFLTAVKIIRYRLQTVKSGGKFSGQLMRGELNDKKIYEEKPVGFNIKSLAFQRETISSPVIYIKIDNSL